jgi:hypothetical protein
MNACFPIGLNRQSRKLTQCLIAAAQGHTLPPHGKQQRVSDFKLPETGNKRSIECKPFKKVQ